MTQDASLHSILSRWDNRRENLLQILIDAQQHYDGLPREVLAQVGAALELSPSEVTAVASFYSFLHLGEPVRYRILFSDSITDRWRDSEALRQRLCERLHGTPENECDGFASIGTTSCTGLPDQGPALLVNGHAIPRLDNTLIDDMAERIRAGDAVTDWPRAWFLVDPGIRQPGPILSASLAPGAAREWLQRRGVAAAWSELEASGLGGRGGAGFSIVAKWRACAATDAEDRAVVCNADEGEPVTFKDRALLQRQFDLVLEGMVLCAELVGARQGLIYLRGEYRFLRKDLERRLDEYRSAGVLDERFDIGIHLGAGSYVCGEESALLESLEGKRGIPRVRPPFPVSHGYLGLPTVVNNVESFAAAMLAVVHGADWFRQWGTRESPGTKLLSISGDCAAPGVYEMPFGISLQEVIERCGAGTPRAVQVAGAAGITVPGDQFQRRIGDGDLATGGSVIIIGQQRDPIAVAQSFADFFAHESCGHCTPCRVGSALLQRGLRRLGEGLATETEIQQMRELVALMQATSHCGLGKTAGNPIRDLLQHFADAWQPRLAAERFTPAIDLQAALAPARRQRETQQQAGMQRGDA
jgi:[NiFe] hydrogenase diaphorase moiety large subunit